mgnify:CR=1 FL=1
MDNYSYNFELGFKAGIESQRGQLLELTLRLEAFEKGDVVPGPDFRRLEAENLRLSKTINKLDQIIIRFVEEKGPLCSVTD